MRKDPLPALPGNHELKKHSKCSDGRDDRRYGTINGHTRTMRTRKVLYPRSLIVCIAITFLLVPFYLFFPPCAGAGSYEEYEVKAAFLYKFAKFVEWPSTAFDRDTDPFLLCVSGSDPFGKALDTLEGKTVGKRKFIIHKLQSMQDVGKCTILFISSSKKAGLQQILKAVRNRQVLTVGDTEGFAQAGVMINFVLQDGRVQFEINPQAVKQAGLTVSSQLLKVSKVVGEGR